MKRKKKLHHQHKKPNNIKTLILYCILVFFIIFIALIIRLITIIHNSKFDGQHEFTMSILFRDNTTDIIGFDPVNKSVSTLVVTSEKRITDMDKVLGLPLDAKVEVPYTFDKNADTSSQLMKLLRHPKSWYKSFTFFDIVHMIAFAKTADASKSKEDSLTLPADETRVNNTVAPLFADATISQENVSIGIINGTGVSGLGQKLEQAMVNIGGNVASVTTARDIQSTSKIQYYGEKTYTLERLSQILHFPLEKMEQKAISDIMITIGTDHESDSVY